MNEPIHLISQLSLAGFVVSCVILIVAAARAWQRERNDPTRALPLPSIPERIDPYQIACLRRGENALAPIAIVQLTDLGYLRVESRRKRWWNPRQKYIVQAEQHPDASRLSALERSVFEWFGPGRKLDEVFKDGELLAMLRVHGSRHEEELHAGQLLTSELGRHPAFATYLLVLSAGVLALSIAVFPYLPFALLFFVIALAIANVGAAHEASSGRRRITYRGIAYLAALEKKYESLKSSPGDRGAPAAAAALFGISILSGTSYAAMTEAFQKSGVSLSIEGEGGCCGGCGCCG